MNFRKALDLAPSYTHALEVDIEAHVAGPVLVLEMPQAAIIPVPVALGLNVMLNVQLAPAANTRGQSFVVE